jgi:hypothetical protein
MAKRKSATRAKSKRAVKKKAARPRKPASRARAKAGKSKTKARARPSKSKAKSVKASKSRMHDVCCEDIDLSKWKLRRIVWKRKPFYVVRHGSFFHIPIGFGKAIIGGLEIVKKKYYTPSPEFVLSKETGWFSAKMMFPVNKASTSDPNIEELTGTFVTRGFQGSYSQMGNFIRVFNEQVKQKFGKKPSELYFWYANCPKCAPKQGGPKIIIFGRI